MKLTIPRQTTIFHPVIPLVFCAGFLLNGISAVCAEETADTTDAVTEAIAELAAEAAGSADSGAPAGGPGTNWENPPGRRGGPGTSPDRRRLWRCPHRSF